MLRKYFYRQFLDLYLCLSSTIEAKDGSPEEQREYWEQSVREIRLQIRTVRKIASDLLGGTFAREIVSEARNDGFTLSDNHVYWITDDVENTIEYRERYKDNPEVVTIINKLI